MSPKKRRKNRRNRRNVNKVAKLRNEVMQLRNEIVWLRSDIERIKQKNKSEIERTKQENKKLDERNKKLVEYIKQLAEKEKKLIALIKKLKQPPNDYAIFVRPHPNGSAEEADVMHRGHMKKVLVLIEGMTAYNLKCGWEVLLNGYDNIIAITRESWHWGESVTFREMLSTDRALVVNDAGALSECYLSPELSQAKLKEGDLLLNCGGLLVRMLPKTEQKEHLKDAEDISHYEWSRVGGLSRPVKQIHRALLPFRKPKVYKDKFKGTKLNRGLILHGPSGCGKTLVAKCIASDLARSRGIKCYFMPIVGAQLSNKYVGQTSENIRNLFDRAKEQAADGSLVLVFIDEMDSLFRSRSASNMEHEPWQAEHIGQFNEILDGVDALGNVFIIGASNHKHLIDNAILRPGRLGVDVRIPRPRSEKDIAEILRIYITSDLPFSKKYLEQDEYEYTDYFDSGKKKKIRLDKDPKKVCEFFVDMVIKRIFYKGEEIQIRLEDEKNGVIKIDNKFSILTARGKEDKYLKDLLSGAALASIVDTAKEIAFDRYDKLYDELAKDVKKELIERGIDSGKLEEELKKEMDKRLDSNIMTEGDFYKAVREEVRRLKFGFKRPEKEFKIGFDPDHSDKPNDEPGAKPDDEPEDDPDDKSDTK